jgi:tRNA(Arg) A34 adenosine deaminase TadA
VEVATQAQSPSLADPRHWSAQRHAANMGLAIREARRAVELGGAAIGAVIVDAGDRVLGVGHSLVGVRRDPLAHAELGAIGEAARRTGRFHLPDLVLYCTLEPCSMCLGACAWAGLGGVFFGADGTVASPALYDRAGYSALEQARDSRRDGYREPLYVRGRICFAETARLLVPSPPQP